MPAEHPLRHGSRARVADGPGGRRRARARRTRCRRDALLHGCGLAQSQGPRPRQGRRNGFRRRGARARDLRDARNADAAAGEALAGSGPRLLQPQPRHLARRTTARSSRHVLTRIASTRSRPFAMRASTSAAAVSSAWANGQRTESHSCTRSRRSTRTPRAFRSTIWCRSREPRSPARPQSIQSSSSGSSRSRGS